MGSLGTLWALWGVLAGAMLLLMLPALLVGAFLPKEKRSVLLQKLKRKLII